MERLATYTVSVPLQFTFTGDNTLDRQQLIDVAYKELINRLANGYFDVLGNKLEVVNKVTHYTSEELAERRKQLFKGVPYEKGLL